MNSNEHHTTGYSVGMKVEVGIPLPSSKLFCDWAIISEVDEDLVALQLSRDVLPDGVILRIGQVLTITRQSDGISHSCRAVIVSKGHANELLLRLTSETVANELREFYRVDAFIPIKFQILNDQNPANVKELWETRRKQRRDEHEARKRVRQEEYRVKTRTGERERAREIQEGGDSGKLVCHWHDNTRKTEYDNQYYESWGDITTLAVNISAGGLRIFTDQKFNTDELILLEIYVPSAHCLAETVARVVYSNYSNITVDYTNCISTAMQFVFIDESARSALNAHISSIQIKRIRHFKGFANVEPIADAVSSSNKQYAYIDSILVSGKGESLDQRLTPKVKRMLQTVGILCVLCLLCFSFYSYRVSHPKSEIQKMIEYGIEKSRARLIGEK
ncbi:MAG: DUF5634 family protein [Desulfuromonadaceae bacterium]|nr:DUF5634 family protein [Desulfuromonadaceae bacterium]MDD5106545.1 DUF5634 family protein [Desulfuromonadaceae bacterium]